MKNLITKLLISRTRNYLAKTKPKIVVIAGSVGKTTVTQATATILAEKYKVKATHANYNTDLGVILTIFDQKIQTNPLGWLLLIGKIWRLSKGRHDSEVYVLELGTDKPGDMKRFSYLKPDFGILTTIAPEHMEYFKTIDKVAEEELALIAYTKKTILGESIDDSWLDKFVHGEVAKTGQDTNTRMDNFSLVDEGSQVTFTVAGKKIEFNCSYIAEHLAKNLLTPALLASEMGLSKKEIKAGLEKIVPLPGRMQVLKGLNNSIIIDDTYNASPEAVKRALDVLYAYPAEKKIALLGMMNELGESSEQHHRDIGYYIDPSKLSLVVTLGEDANNFLALAAEERGCIVKRAKSALEAAEILRDELTPSTVLLAKGSQNGVYAEEAIKPLLLDLQDASKLVRQTAYWPDKKKRYFESFKQR